MQIVNKNIDSSKYIINILSLSHGLEKWGGRSEGGREEGKIEQGRKEGRKEIKTTQYQTVPISINCYLFLE